jgi:hypothetical protein
MVKPGFKKAVDTNRETPSLQQPKRFMGGNLVGQTWADYRKKIVEEQETYESEVYSIVFEPALKDALKLAGKNLGRTNGGTRAIVREALLDYFDKHTDLFK